MKQLKWIIPGILTIAIVGYFVMKPKLDAKNLDYTYIPLVKGHIEAVVSSTGTLEAINTVEIGTQISGTIKKIYVDYNDKVTAGQLLAEMDLNLLQTNLISAQANLAVAQAQLNQVRDTYNRNQVLYEKSVISEQEYKDSQYSYDQALSAREASLAAVKNIKVSIEFAHIKSPINGTVTERSVEEGQTVAASFATPKMFVIAEDLSKMQILADVDESDIGYISNGLQVRFTVQTYPEKVFNGKVSQIRLQPIQVNNVVNYQVVVDVDNHEGRLLPGMTASLEFITQSAKDVLLINNSALRFRPNTQMLNEIKPILEQKAKKMLPDSIQQGFLSALNSEEQFTPANFKKSLPANINGFFYKDTAGKLDFNFIEIRIKTGMQSQIIGFMDGSELGEQTKAINGIKSHK